MKPFHIILVIALFAIAVSAQKADVPKPDLSGTWEYALRDSPFKDRVLVVKQNGDEISYVETYEFKNEKFMQRATLFADDRGETYTMQYPGTQAPSSVISKTHWDKGKLLRTLRYEYVMESRGTRYTVTVDEEQTWSLSKDGETLTVNIRSQRDAPAVAPIPVPTTGKSVYKRKH